MTRLTWMQRRFAVLLVLAGCGDRVPSYDGASFAHDPAPVGSLVGKILTSNNGDDTLSIVDPETPGMPGRLPVGFNPVELEGPHHLSVDPAGRFIYVNLAMSAVAAGAGPHGMHGLSTTPGFVLKLDTHGGGEVDRAQVEANPGDNTLSADGKTLYVTHYDLGGWFANSGPNKNPRDGDSKLVVIDTETMAVKARVPICPAAHGVRLSPDDKQLYATCGPDEIAVVDLPAMTVRRVPLAPNGTEAGNCIRCPYALAVAPDGVVWVSSQGNAGARGFIHLFDPSLPGGGDLDQLATTQLRGGAMFAAFVGTKDSYRAFVPEQGIAGDHVHVYQPQPRGMPPTELADLALDRADCQNAHMMLAAGHLGQLVCEGASDHTKPGSFVWLDLDTPKVLGSAKLGVFPDGLALVRPQ
jgi:hypothetical protein